MSERDLLPLSIYPSGALECSAGNHWAFCIIFHTDTTESLTRAGKAETVRTRSIVPS